MFQSRLKLILFLLIALSVSPAFADSTANASLSNLTATLYSLNSTVTPTPNLTFNIRGHKYESFDPANFLGVETTDNRYIGNSEPTHVAHFEQIFTDGNIAVSLTNTQVIAEISGINAYSDVYWNYVDPDPYEQNRYARLIGSIDSMNGTNAAGVTISASGSALSTGGSIDLPNNFSSIASAFIFGFNLSPYSVAVFNATATTQAKTTGSYDNAYAIVTLGGTSLVSNAKYGSEQNIQNSELLSVSFANETDRNLTGYFTFEAFASGSSYVSAVPEPETYAMLILGLSLIAYITRRRKDEQA